MRECYLIQVDSLREIVIQEILQELIFKEIRVLIEKKSYIEKNHTNDIPRIPNQRKQVFLKSNEINVFILYFHNCELLYKIKMMNLLILIFLKILKK